MTSDTTIESNPLGTKSLCTGVKSCNEISIVNVRYAKVTVSFLISCWNLNQTIDYITAINHAPGVFVLHCADPTLRIEAYFKILAFLSEQRCYEHSRKILSLCFLRILWFCQRRLWDCFRQNALKWWHQGAERRAFNRFKICRYSKGLK